MKILAVELSADVGWVACLKAESVIATAEVPPSRRGAATLFEVLERVRAEAGWADWSEVDVFAAGRGPGRYSGMRVALTAVQHLALPGGRPVRAIDSGTALAAEWANERSDVDRIWVIGDARRDRIWRGVFECEDGSVRLTEKWSLLSITDCAHELNDLKGPQTLWVVSSDWDRLSDRLTTEGMRESDAWRRVAGSPSAEWIGRLAYREEMADAVNASPLPIYLHPAVANAAGE